MMQDSIKRFVDKSIEEQVMPEFDFFYVDKTEISDSRFLDESKIEKDGKLAWKAIPSLISDKEIEEFENTIKVKLPNSFKEYLKYKNFYSLFNLNDVWMFCPLVPDVWSEKILKETFDGYPREYIYDKGLIPFADFSDWGLTCFNTTRRLENGEFEIVMWDHERPDETEHLANSIYELFEKALEEFENSTDE